MRLGFQQLDELLRGRKTAPPQLADGKVDLPLRMFVPLAIGLGAVYGFFMGWYAISGRSQPGYEQLIASTVKLPALFLLTLLVTFPSLYVFNALVGCRLSFTAMLRLLVGAITVDLAVAASLGPILGFFTLSTQSYAFMVILNVALLAVAGVVGLGFLLQTLRRLTAWVYWRPPVAEPADAAQPPMPSEPGPLEVVPGDYPRETLGAARSIFRIWVLIYALVGAQMGWLLRPFIGSPDMPFTWFRAREGNFFLALATQLKNLAEGR
ncbi:MAG TPA: hypothetical protein VGM03_12865 [Phycisphaerae bacterium]|jgi:hypothetical protein